MSKCPAPTHPHEFDDRPIDGAGLRHLPVDAIHTQKMEAVGQLAGGIAHDLSNLMTAMFGWLEIASSQLPADHDAREALKMVDRAARQAVGLTRSLLAFSHRTPTERRRMSLNDSVRDVQRLLSRLLPASIEQRSVIPDQTVWIDGDDAQIQQVLMNLALNARDAIDGAGTIDIAVEPRPRAGVPAAAEPDRFPHGAAVLRVTDTGCGISEASRARIFEPFFTTKDRHRGTGLGLAIVHAIITDMGGWIDVESVIGRGSRFTIYLPRALAPVGRIAAAAAPPGARVGGAGVLVIEDNPHVRAMLTTVLVDAGYRVFEAADGARGQALHAEHCGEIDVALVDIDLPKINGLDVLDAMLKKCADTGCIAMTGYPLDAAGLRRLAAMDCRLLRKPFQVPDLKQLMADVVRRRRPVGGKR